jgi:hypothetical protein
MSTAGDYQKIQRIVSVYRQKLEVTGEDVFQQSPSDGSWSYSEAYFHIFDASLLTLQTINDCIEGNGKNKNTPWISRLILFFDTLPPGQKYKAPSMLADRLRKISKKEAFELMDQFLLGLESSYSNLLGADPNKKTRHPRLGYFNAFQWFRFMEIHLNHHLKQTMRLHKHF